MSGCPERLAGQHHIGSIGFYGASMKVGDRQNPRLQSPTSGGRYDWRRGWPTATRPQGPPARKRRVPDAVGALGIRLCTSPEARGRPSRSTSFVDRVGRRAVPGRGQGGLAMCRSSFNLDNFPALHRTGAAGEPYKVVRGEGRECAGPDDGHDRPARTSSAGRPEELLGYMVEALPPAHVRGRAPFQKEASVILDMLVKIEPEARLLRARHPGVPLPGRRTTPGRRSRTATASRSTCTRA